LILALVYGIPLAAITVLAYLWLRDEPPPYDEDLKVQRIQIPEDQNAFTYLLRATGKFQRPRGDAPLAWDANKPGAEYEPRTEAELFHQIVRGTRWDGQFVDSVLKKNAEALALWQQVLAAPQFQLPQVRSIEDRIPYIFDCLDLANLVSLRAKTAARQAEYEAAYQDQMKLVRFGQRMAGAKGCLVEYLVASTIKAMGASEMADMTGECTLSSARLRAYAAELAKYPADPQGLADAYRGEYAMYCGAVDDFWEGRYCGGPSRFLAPTESPGMDPDSLPVWKVWIGPLLKRNRTKGMFAQACRRMVENAPKAFREVPPRDASIGESGFARDILSGNPIGCWLYRALAPATEGAHEQMCRERIQLGATRVLLAMKAYKLDKGALPRTLDELVPQYLNAVPIDDYDGKPMRYNAAKKVVYSVGRDLKDGGGMTMEDYLKARRKEFDESGMSWDEKAQAEQAKDNWHWPDPSFEIKF
jgi:hypothetical protein